MNTGENLTRWSLSILLVYREQRVASPTIHIPFYMLVDGTGGRRAYP